MRGASAKTQPRGAGGKFIKRPQMFPLGEQTWSQQLEDVDGWGPKSELMIVRRPSRLSNLKRLISHHRVAIIGYSLYLLLIAVVAVLGAYCGAKFGLQ